MHQQRLDPLADFLPAGLSQVTSTFLAFLPVLVLFYLLVVKRWEAPLAGAVAGFTAFLVAVFVYRMPWAMGLFAYLNGALFGLLPIGWTVISAMMLYNLTVETGCFASIKRSVETLSGDPRIQAVLIGFCFGAFLEGAAGSGTPVAICGAILVGLGFHPIQAAVLCLLANTSPVAYGGLGTPMMVLGNVTEIPPETLSVMAAHQLPFLSLLVPLYMTICLAGVRGALQVWPVLLVSGGSFAAFQYAFATFHTWVPGVMLFLMTDIGGGFFSLGCTALFLSYFWKGQRELPFPPPVELPPGDVAHFGAGDSPRESTEEPKRVSVFVGWLPFLLMSVFLVVFGLLRQSEEKTVHGFDLGGISSRYKYPMPMLHNLSVRDPALLAPGAPSIPEKAEYSLNWLTTPGSSVFFSILLSVVILRPSFGQIGTVITSTARQMVIPIPTIAVMLGMSYLTRFAGMDATLGIAFAQTGALYPFFAAMLGWLGVFLTGTDAGSNALFGSLQKITAIEVHGTGVLPLSSAQAQVLLCTANSTGGVMGKMIDAQSIVVATSATGQSGKEAEIFKKVVWHSVVLAAVVGLITMAQAYLWPFTGMVPSYEVQGKE